MFLLETEVKSFNEYSRLRSLRAPGRGTAREAQRAPDSDCSRVNELQVAAGERPKQLVRWQIGHLANVGPISELATGY
jgi:hypothetical protein